MKIRIATWNIAATRKMATFGTFTVATTHTEPLGLFGLSYDRGTGKILSQEIDALLAKSLTPPCCLRPILTCIPYQTDALPKVLSVYGLQEALPDQPTTPYGVHPDHILFSREWKLTSSGIVHTASDHFLCWSELELLAT